MLACDIRDRWWHGSRGWTFPLVSHYISWLCDRWKQRGYDRMTSDMEVHMKQRCAIEFLRVEKNAPSDIHQYLLNVYEDQTADVRTVRWWVVHFSSSDDDIKDKPCSGWPCTVDMPWSVELLDQFICSNWQIINTKLCTELNIGFSTLSIVVRTLENHSLCQVDPMNAHAGKQKRKQKPVHKFVRTHWANMNLKVMASWVTSLLVTRCGITTVSWSQNSNVWIPHWRKISRHRPQWVKW